MSYDLFADLAASTPQDVDSLSKGALRGRAVDDIAGRIRLLAGAGADRSLKDRAVGAFSRLVHAQGSGISYNRQIQQRLAAFSLLHPPAGDSLVALPAGSWFLQFTFMLAKPYISQDDVSFYVTDGVNPLRKDKAFQVPMAAASSWKGLLRWTMAHERLVRKRADLNDHEFAQQRLKLALLFGDEKGEELHGAKDVAAFLNDAKPSARSAYVKAVKDQYDVQGDAPELPHHAGRLIFFPTFFDRIGLEVINPHSRETRAGRFPIYLECVPSGARGTFSLLYVPFDRIGARGVLDESLADLRRVAEALPAMMLTYGFSAKRSSGYGTARETIADVRLGVCTRGLPRPQAPPPPEAPPTRDPSLPRYLIAPGEIDPHYLNPEGTFRERDEAELRRMKKADRQLYDKARAWWEREGRALAQKAAEPPKEEGEPDSDEPVHWRDRPSMPLMGLSALAEEVAQALTAGGAT